MKVAVIGSRGLLVENLGDYLPEGTTEIVSGGAAGAGLAGGAGAAGAGVEAGFLEGSSWDGIT